MNKKNPFRAAVPAFLVMLLAAPALHATPIYAPQVGVPEAYPDPGDVPILDSVEGTFSFGSGAGLLSGRYEQGVLVDPFNKTCTGCLDFFIRLELDTGLSNNIFTLETGPFPELSSVPLDIGYVTGTGKAPPLALRTEAGMIRYLFGDQIRPGESSAYLVVATNATEYGRTGGFLVTGNLQGGGSGSVTGLFGPTATQVPEPGTLMLIAMGVAGLLFFRRRRLATE
jgi:PEP-CTERM motif